ncbi:hypothetical protein PNA2_1736 [Pyrococcus sp. NA2]|uniref:hypothetical protein n=1 Tax=Pyrococcus sp. (strain NA2) TaxID=342949 RepID=UPI000209AB21|nr:hypothetical protein [Pyrococcus sp. NA2]AEC52650.1 hypothetical protein PNA2_1736 [Pyrococcus sp. NA2]
MDFGAVISTLLLYAILIAFLSIKLFLSMLRFMGKVIVRSEDVDKRAWPDIIFNIVTIVGGIFLFLHFYKRSILLAITLPLAFRSGSNFGRFLMYLSHDLKILKDERGKFEIISTALLTIEGTFLVALILLPQVINVTLKGISRPIYVWVIGLVFGMILGLIVSRTSRKILMKDSISLLALFGVRKVKRRLSRLYP